MNFDTKTLLGLIAIIMTIWAHIPYLRTTLTGVNKPHIFTWVIWTLLTFIAFAAQVVGHAGPGAWVTGVTGIICVIITVAAFKRGDKHITRGDWAMFLAGLAALPLWAATSDPLWSVIIVTLIDCSAFWPTFRKSWLAPHQENSFMYGFNVPRHMIALCAVQSFSMVTALYPSMLLIMNVVMYVMLKMRRKA